MVHRKVKRSIGTGDATKTSAMTDGRRGEGRTVVGCVSRNNKKAKNRKLGSVFKPALRQRASDASDACVTSVHIG